MWFGSDRRVVLYPCNDNELLNFVCIHPDTESHATPSDGRFWFPYEILLRKLMDLTDIV